MISKWPRVSLDQLLRLERRRAHVRADVDYQEIGIYCFGRGIFHKPPRTGMEVGDKDLFVIKPGDFILQVTFAWEGAVAIASSAEDGMHGSTRYPTFRVNESRCLPSFLLYYFKTKDGIRQLTNISPGSAGRNRVLSLKRINEVFVPLPPLPEQLQVVTQAEHLIAKINETQTLRRLAITSTNALIEQSIEQELGRLKCERVPLESLLREGSRNGLAPRPSNTPPGTPILRISAATSRPDAVVDESDIRYLEVSDSESEKYSLCPGDLLACRFNGNLHFVGKFAIFTGSSGERRLYPDKLIRFRIDPKKAFPEYVRTAMNGRGVRSLVEGSCATTAGNIGISSGDLKAILLPVPPLIEQRRITLYIDELHAEVAKLRRLQDQTETELSALLSSVINTFFQSDS
jgi:type I restriction enzyme S subunit